MSAAACWGETPSRSRPITEWLYIMPRACRSNGVNTSGSHTSAGCALARGRAAPWKLERRRHDPDDRVGPAIEDHRLTEHLPRVEPPRPQTVAMTATRDSRWSSSAENVRPCAAATPSTSKTDAVSSVPCTGSGSPRPDISSERIRYAPIAENDC